MKCLSRALRYVKETSIEVEVRALQIQALILQEEFEKAIKACNKVLKIENTAAIIS